MLHRLARQLPGTHVLLYIDQFEEVFTQTETPTERQQFIDLITHAATEPEGKLIIVLTMRADFYGHPMHYPQLGTLVSANNTAVLPMTISELWDAIEKPARLPDVGLTFDDGLAAEIIFALRERDKALAGALPLLEFTLTRLFAQREGTRLTFAAYHDMDGVEGAIGAHCDAVFTALPPAAQDSLGMVFLPLVNIDEDTGEATRRRAPLETLSADANANALIEALVDNRLLQTGRDGSLTYLEIAHEALFRSWERLVRWLETTRQDLRLLRQIEREAADWDAAGRSYLLTAERLKPIHAAVVRLGYTLSPVMQDFVYPQKLLLQELNHPATNDQRRLRIGDDLALLGDTRRGVALTPIPSPSGRGEFIPDIAWLPVAPGGKIEIEGKRFTVQPFYVAQYLVTYAQYQAFVDAEDGFNLLDWWRDFPKKYRPQKLAEQRTKSPNNPRDSVSWYQSVAFARWLDAKYREYGLFAQFPVGTPFLASADDGGETGRDETGRDKNGRVEARPYKTIALNPD